MTIKRFYLYLIIVGLGLACLSSYVFSEEMASQTKEPATTEAPVAVAASETAVQETGPVVKEEVTADPKPIMNVEIPIANVEIPKGAEVPEVLGLPKAAETKPAEETKEIKWVWGEVGLVDAASNKIVVKYLNYDTDVEETLAISIDNTTRFENAEGINAIKVGDNVGVDYMLNATGEAIAKSIALEKAESMPNAPEETKEAPVSQEAAPISQVNASN